MKEFLLKFAAESFPEEVDFILKTAEVIDDEDKEEYMFSLNAIMEDTVEQIGKNKEVFKEASIKEASFAEGAKNFGKAVGATALTGVTVAMLNDLVSSAHEAITRNRNFNKMVAYAPDLKERDPKTVRAVFNALHSLGGPKITSEPHVAAEYVRNQVDLPGSMSNPKNISDLVGARSNIDRSGVIDRSTEVPGLDLSKLRLDKKRVNLEKQRVQIQREQTKEKSASVDFILSKIRKND